MKKIAIFFGALMMLFLPLAFGAGTSAEKFSPGANVEITLLNQEPDPAEPGDSVEIRFNVENSGSEKANYVELELVPEFPFFLQPGENAIKYAGTLQSKQDGADSAIIKYKLLVDEDAVEGNNTLTLRYRFNNEAWRSIEDFEIEVQTHDAILVIESVKSEKATLEQGSSSLLTIALENQADSLLKDIVVSLDLDGTPFIPLGSGDSKSIKSIASRQKTIVQFNILIKPEAASGVYTLPINLSYADELGATYDKDVHVGLIVGSEPDISITLDDTGIYQSGSRGEIIVKVVNKGVADTKFVNVKLLPAETYRILSTNEIYLGNIDSDDFETAAFYIFVEGTGESMIVLPIELEYKDANNKDYKKRIDLSLSLYSSPEAKKFGFAQGNSKLGILLIVVIVAVGIYFYYRRRRKKKG